jgi:hypothetical protein
MSLCFDAIVTHLFASKQKRSFDLLNNGNGSRYMLVQKISSPIVGLHVGLAPLDQAAINQYQGRLVPAINRTTLDTTVSVDIQADVSIGLNYQCRCWQVDGGYNMWFRSHEKLDKRDCLQQGYAVKGDAQLYGFSNPGEVAVALNATQSKATINRGQSVTSPVFAMLDPGNFNENFEYAKY